VKPISLKFTAFGPYVEEQSIDFSQLSKAGLFLICGETGAGKTAILDAMTYALYGKSSGGSRGDFTTMRCQFAPIEVKTSVEYVFKIKSRIYKFTRGLKAVKKRAGGFEFHAEQNALFQNEQGVFEPFFENPKIKDVEEKANNLIGLNYEQFRQVIILPQGQFEKLLVAKSDEKEEILVSLFNANKWNKISDYLTGIINTERNRLDIERADIDAVYKNYECNNQGELNNLLTDKQNMLTEKKEKQKKVSKNLEMVNSEYEMASKLNDRFSQKEEVEKKLALLKAQEEKYAAKRMLFKMAEKANGIKPIYDNLKTANKNVAERQKNVNAEKNNHSELSSKFELATKASEELSKQGEAHEAEKVKLTKLTFLIEPYQNFDMSKKSADKAQEDYKRAKEKADAQKMLLEKLEQEKLSLQADVADLRGEYFSMFNQYRANIGGQLAKDLKENESCPVCGSTHHPKLATLKETDMTSEMLEKKDSQIKEAEQKLEKKDSHIKTENEKNQSLNTKMEKLVTSKEKTLAQYTTLLSNIDKDIPNMDALDSMINSLQKKIDGYIKRVKETTETLKQITQQYTASHSAVELAVKEYEKALAEETALKAEFDTELGKCAFVNMDEFLRHILTADEQEVLSKEINTYDTDIKALSMNLSNLCEELQGKEKPDIDAVKTAKKAIEDENQTVLTAIGLDEKSAQDLTKLIQKFTKRIKKQEADKKIFDSNLLFVKQIRGDNGVSLQRYVLGVMLSAITNEANRLLENVYDGRYKLYRTIETTGRTRKAGLELEVYDSLSNERRSVVSLSGGEKFLVSLSLSIGLSTVVQAQSGGIKLDAMFIDEGFGSLDRSSIDDAFMILSKIKQNSGLVGIISHVAILRENIDSKIEIEKGKNGSRLTVKA